MKEPRSWRRFDVGGWVPAPVEDTTIAEPTG
jgi:hypothetical protein